MKDFFIKLIKFIFAPLKNIICEDIIKDYESCSKKLKFYTNRYVNLIRETEAIYREIIFKNLPKCQNSNRLLLLSKLENTDISKAIYIIEYLHQSILQKGDIIFFGTSSGSLVSLIANEIHALKKKLYLLDDFKGFPKPTEKDELNIDVLNLGSIKNYEGKMEYSLENLKNKLDEVSINQDNVKIIPGQIENTVKLNSLQGKISFAYIHFSFYKQIKISLDFLKERLSKHCYIIVNDYGYLSQGSKTAVDEFMEKNYKKFEMFLPYNFTSKFCIIYRRK